MIGDCAAAGATGAAKIEVMPTSSAALNDSPRARSPIFVTVLAWLLPGCGHFLLGRRGRGAIFFATVLIKRAVNLAKGSAEPHKTKVGKITQKQVEEIAKIKMPDLNCFDLESAMNSVRGTARSMGVDVV